MKLVTAAEMRALERATVEAGTSLDQLMEEAGLAVAQEAWMLLGTLEGRKITVLAGPGNNGGDGLVAARHLADWGASVLVYVPRARTDEPGYAELLAREVTIVTGEEDPGALTLDQALTEADLVIDALLGIGNVRPLDPAEPVGHALARLAAARGGYTPPKILAVDLPSGMNADSGAVDPLAVPAEMTVTFGLPKVGMYQGAAAAYTGRVQVIDIGIPKALMESVGLELLTSRWAREHLPPRPEDANKGTFGRVIVVGGCSRYIGAVRLAAEAAYRAGSGLVTIACPAGLVPAIAPSLAEATWLPQETAADGGLRGESALALRGEWQNFYSAIIGPGMGNTDDTRGFIWAVLPELGTEIHGGTVVDADALNALSTMADAAERIPANAVLTPHPGELARLLGTTVADIQSRRLDAARDSARRFGCTVVLKGAHSVIAHPDGPTALSPFANPLMATAGAGDVLAGMIGGYLAQGLEPFVAASLGVYLHGACGEAFREEYGSAGLLAGELSARLPRVVKQVAAP